MRVHVLAGCSELLEPQVLPPEDAQSLIGPSVRTASAGWLSPGPESRYHSALQDEPGDRRTAIMALALNEEFGTRFEPLLVLSKLLDETEKKDDAPCPAGKRSQLEVLSELKARGRLRELRLYGLALPDGADPEGSWAVPAGIVASAVHERIENLRAASAAEPGTIETEVIEATPGERLFGILYGNAICNQIAVRLQPRLRACGWTCDNDVLARAIGGVLKGWSKKGINPALPLRAGDLDAMTNLVFEKLL